MVRAYTFMALILIYVVLASLGLGLFNNTPIYLFGCIFGYLASVFASSQIRALDSKICSYSKDTNSGVDRFCSFMTKATCFISLIHPALPLVTIIVGIICLCRTLQITLAEQKHEISVMQMQDQFNNFEYSDKGTRILHKGVKL